MDNDIITRLLAAIYQSENPTPPSAPRNQNLNAGWTGLGPGVDRAGARLPKDLLDSLLQVTTAKRLGFDALPRGIKGEYDLRTQRINVPMHFAEIASGGDGAAETLAHEAQHTRQRHTIFGGIPEKPLPSVLIRPKNPDPYWDDPAEIEARAAQNRVEPKAWEPEDYDPRHDYTVPPQVVFGDGMPGQPMMPDEIKQVLYRWMRDNAAYGTNDDTQRHQANNMASYAKLLENRRR